MNRTAVVALALALAACGGDDDDGAVTTTTAQATTTTEATTTTTEPTTTTASASGCDDIAVPGDATDISSTGADVDGDGESDDSSVYLAGGEWHLHVALSSGGAADVVIDEPSADVGGAAVLGGADVNGDGNDEIWAKVGAGASVELVGLYDVVGCEVVPVTRAGAPAVFPVGATVLNASGVRCDDVDGNGALDFVVELSATSSDGNTFDGRAVELAFDPGPAPSLSQVDLHAESFDAADPQITDYSRFQCGDIAR